MDGPGAGHAALADRAFDHAQAIEEWLAARPMSPEPVDCRSLLVPPEELRLECAAAPAVGPVREAGLKLWRLFPDRVELLDRIVDIEFQRTKRSLMIASTTRWRSWPMLPC